PVNANGFPLNVDQQFMMMSFDSTHQNQRASLLLLNGVVYAAYSGHDGDCDPYYGWVIGVPVTNATGAVAWRTRGERGGIWGGGAGIASDGAKLFAVTGNTS